MMVAIGKIAKQFSIITVIGCLIISSYVIGWNAGFGNKQIRNNVLLSFYDLGFENGKIFASPVAEVEMLLRSGLWTGDEDGTLRFAGKLMYLGKTVEGESKAKIIADAHNL